MTASSIKERRGRSESAGGRLLGSLITLLALAVAGVLALPGSTSDRTEATVYPLMLLPVVLIIGIAGLVAACRPATAGTVAVICAVNGLQVAGIALVATRDWLNFGGADESSYQRALVGSWLALAMAAIAVGVVVASVKLYRCRAGQRSGLPPRPAMVIAGLAVAAGLPISSYVFWHEAGLSAVGQVALWWSLPWAAGLYAAGVLPAKALRAAALSSVTISVALTLVCAAAAPVHGFGLRLPYGFGSPLLHYAGPRPTMTGDPNASTSSATPCELATRT
ncbi:hypothetical protein [Actinoplanes sp. NPDC049599]|uniref:hypothetical protein n=1 Tax=Actinoplanes sp. NPDC049599 TaxID=3363903 RepID=UPI0037B016F6